MPQIIIRRTIATAGYLLSSAILLIALTGCSSASPANSPSDSATDASSPSASEQDWRDTGTGEPAPEATATYTQIDQETAKEMMARDDGHAIVDVRRQDEYDAGHIPDAILMPNESITDERPAELPDTEQVILIHCRSGRRSKEAAQKLADMGYAHVYEFGGIIDWTGDVVTGDATA